MFYHVSPAKMSRDSVLILFLNILFLVSGKTVGFLLESTQFADNQTTTKNKENSNNKNKERTELDPVTTTMTQSQPLLIISNSDVPLTNLSQIEQLFNNTNVQQWNLNQQEKIPFEDSSFSHVFVNAHSGLDSDFLLNEINRVLQKDGSVSFAHTTANV